MAENENSVHSPTQQAQAQQIRNGEVAEHVENVSVGSRSMVGNEAVEPMVPRE